MLWGLVILAILPRLSAAQVVLAPAAPVCTANIGVSGGQQSSVNTASNEVRARAEGGAAGTGHFSFAEVGVHFVPAVSMQTTIRMEGIWPRGRLEGFGNVNAGSYKVRVILRDLTANTEIGDQVVFENEEDGAPFAKKIKLINNPFNLGVAQFDADLKATNEYAMVMRLETEANGLIGLADFLSDELRATFTCVTTGGKDSDGDGLPDEWEVSGIDIDGDGMIDLDLNALGADPSHKDIFVEIDFFDCGAAGGDCNASDTHFHQPDPAALALIRQSFANAPVSNPDGKSGINLWVQVGEKLPHQAVCDLNPPGCFDAVKATNFGTPGERTNANALNILAAKKLAFHYNLWVHDKNSGNSSSGEAEGGGNDFVVSLGSWSGQVGMTTDQAGVFMHELGHNLGLSHGGVDGKNCKPNYLSVMSYTLTVTGLQPSGNFDYSRSALPSLQENNLNENLGIQDGAFTTIYGPGMNLGQGTGPIDWDLDGDPTDNPAASSDINNLGITGCGASPNETLKGFNDWSNLTFNFRASPDFADGVHQLVADEELDFQTAQAIKERVWRAQTTKLYEYSAKVVCGMQDDSQEMRLARGFYATTINIHNPENDDVRFFKKLALTYPPEGQQPGKIVPIGMDSLRDDEALKVDCVELEKTVFKGKFPTPYIEGYLVIQSERSLDVTGVYSTAALDEKGLAADHSSIEIEQIKERVKTVGFPDLIPVAPLPPPSTGGPEGFPGILYCVKPATGGASNAIRVTINNKGVVEAKASAATVDFMDAGNLVVPTSKLQPGEETTLEIAIPKGCYPPGFSQQCRFRIRADSFNQVKESNEKNNLVESFCSSPAG